MPLEVNGRVGAQTPGLIGRSRKDCRSLGLGSFVVRVDIAHRQRYRVREVRPRPFLLLAEAGYTLSDPLLEVRGRARRVDPFERSPGSPCIGRPNLRPDRPTIARWSNSSRTRVEDSRAAPSGSRTDGLIGGRRSLTTAVGHCAEPRASRELTSRDADSYEPQPARTGS